MESTQDDRGLSHGRLTRLFALEALGSVSSSLMMLGIFFYMDEIFKWNSLANLALSSLQGVVYIIGALSADAISTRIGRQRLLCFLNAGLAVMTCLGFFTPYPLLIGGILLVYTMLLAAQWPALESLVSDGSRPEELSRRISVYNLIWSGTGAVTMAISGLVIAHLSRGFFLLATGTHGVSLLILFQRNVETAHAVIPRRRSELHDLEVLRLRTLAMRLSRISLPATYAVVYSIGAMMPTLPVVLRFPPEIRTLIASAWMAARFLSFIFLGASIWWHTRPRALWLAALVLLVAFLGVVIPASAMAPGLHLPFWFDATTMILWQVVLGLAIGIIYFASLYFGMVLSDGSTEHGGYHEALIGLGSVLGPGVGALALIAGGSQGMSIFAVAAVLAISAAASSLSQIPTRGNPMATR